VNGKNNSSKVLVSLALALGTAFLYAPVLGFDFVNYDDPLYVINNFHIRSLNHQFLVWCFQPGYAFMWHPLTWMSHALDFQFYGILHPGGHHATSLALHILNSILLFLLLNRMTKALWRSAIVAALFAWHPLHVESVAWISERKDVLSAFFWMLTIWAYIRYVEENTKKNHGFPRGSAGSSSPNPNPNLNPNLNPNPNPNPNPSSSVPSVKSVRTLGAPPDIVLTVKSGSSAAFYILALLFFALGLMAKPMVVTLPFVLLLLDWWPLRRINPGGAGPCPAPLNPEEIKSHGSTESRPTGVVATVLRLLAEKIPFFGFSVIASFVTLGAASRTILPLASFSLVSRLTTAVVMYWRYIQKMIWPQNMVVAYPFDYPYSGQEVLTAGVFVIVVSVIAIRLWKKRPFWLTGWFSYLGILVPVIGLVQVGAQPMADRYTYLSSIGIFLIVCWEGWDIARDWRHGRAIAGVAAAAALWVCCLLSGRQLQYWRNPYTLHQHSIAVMPNSVIAHTDYAAFLRDDLHLEAARAECEKAIHLDPNFAFAHQVLGGVLLLEGKLEQADVELRKALSLDPRRLDVHADLGQVALARNAPVEAAAQYGAVLAAEPSNPQARVGLGQALAMQGRLDDARAQLVEALRLTPQYPEAHHQLAVVLALQHHTPEAVSEYRKALKLHPDRADTLNNLAWILATDPRPENRDGVEAVNLAFRACVLTHDQQPMMIGTLAAAYAEAGSFDDAVAAAQRAHDLAVEQGKQALAAKNLDLLALYRAHRAYHEQ
jgi:Tfp pilus assembly protein PilF